jgi:serine/threonine-protein kinase
MELLTGKSLLSVLQHRGALAQKPALHVIRELLTALAFVHERHIIHRDVKPANLYLTPRGGAPWEVRLIDFGIAKQTRERVPDTLELDDDPGAFGPIIGTPEYMAPEQVLGHGADSRSDLYAVGVVLYRLISGELPFKGPHRRVIYERHLRDRPPALVSALGEPLPDGLVEIVERALMKQPEARLQSASAFLEALDAL